MWSGSWGHCRGTPVLHSKQRLAERRPTEGRKQGPSALRPGGREGGLPREERSGGGVASLRLDSQSPGWGFRGPWHP